MPQSETYNRFDPEAGTRQPCVSADGQKSVAVGGSGITFRAVPGRLRGRGAEGQMTLADTRMRRDVQKEIVKRDIESNAIVVQVINSVVYLDGEVRPIRGMIVDLRREKEIIEEVVRGMKGVRDVINNLKVPL
jgi:hypothetical protein